MKSLNSFRIQQLTYQQQANVKGGETERDGSPSRRKQTKDNSRNTGGSTGSIGSGGSSCGCGGGSDRANF